MSRTMAAIYRALGGPWDVAAEVEDAEPEPRQVLAAVMCRHETAVPWSTENMVCGWTGQAVVSCWDDTREALWVCPSEHENSEDWADFA